MFLPFSKRRQIADDAVRKLREIAPAGDMSPLNIVTALDALGYLVQNPTIPNGTGNRGVFYQRTRFNDAEKAFADAWEHENKKRPGLNFGYGLLQDLFIGVRKGVGHPTCYHKVSRSERMVAATVVQWLGTNCGLAFLNEVLRKFGYHLERRSTETRWQQAEAESDPNAMPVRHQGFHWNWIPAGTDSNAP